MATAIYADTKIESLTVSVYSCSWQLQLSYQFKENLIQVDQKKYTYKVALSEVKSDDDMCLDSHLNYILDYEGDIVETNADTSDIVNVFEDLRQQVAFKLDK